jgi:cysteine-rich repeat protein
VNHTVDNAPRFGYLPAVHRPALLLPLLALACGSSDTNATADATSQPSVGETTADPTSTSTLPTTTLPTTTGDPTTAADTTAPVDPTTSTDAPTTATSDPTTDATTTTTDTTGADTTSTGPDDTSTGTCPEGQEGCPCGPGDDCDPGLECQAGECVVDVPECGDGEVEGDEACDLGGMNANTGACKLDCTLQACGDGFVGPGEACDDGNQTGGDGCEADCVPTPVEEDACGEPADGPWIEIDYDGAFSPTNPDWSYSPTPGWGEPEWAPQGQNWPYINALNGVVIHQDQGVIGTSAKLDGTNKAIRVFIGLEGLVDYAYATACVEGRSYSVGSSVTFRVENALNDCGGQGMMANDWFSLHPTSVEIGPECFLPGNDFQAIEIRPVGGSGSMSLKRMRFTLHGAVY